METSRIQSIDLAKLLRAGEGLVQVRPLGLALGANALAGLILVASLYAAASLGGTLGFLMGALGGLLAFVIFAAAFSGVGVMLMDKAKGLQPRSTGDALIFGAFSLPRFLLFGAFVLVASLVIILLASIIYLLCKIPFIGPLLLLLAHPTVVVLSGAFFMALVTVALPLFAPAIWDGKTFKESLLTVYAAARHKLLEVVLMLMAVYFIAGVVGMLISSALLPSYFFMSTLAAGIIGIGFEANVQQVIQSMTRGQFDGHFISGTLASLALLFVSLTLMSQVLTMGVNLAYLSLTGDLNLESLRQSLDARMAATREKAREMQERARQQAAATTGMPAAPQMAAATVGEAHSATACNRCGSSVSPQDAFCGHCGNRLG